MAGRVRDLVSAQHAGPRSARIDARAVSAASRRDMGRAVPTPRARGRMVVHGLALAGVAALVLASASAFAPPRTTAASVGRGAGGPAAEPEPPAPAWMLVPSPVETPTAAPTPSLAQGNPVPAATPHPPVQPAATPARISVPEWVRSVRETGLWSGPDDRAVYFTSLPADSYLKPLGPYLGGRLLAYYAGDGDARQPGQVWVDAQAVEPSGPPPWSTLASSGSAAFKALAVPPRRVSDAPPPEVTARHVAIVDEASGQLLYGKQEDTRVPPASTTKILTTTLALEHSPDLNRLIQATVSASEMVNRDGSSTMGLEPGLEVSLKTLLYGMMLPSGNDAAEQVALVIGGTRERFVEMMNQKVAWLGLKNTRFANPSGMDDPNHYSSAYDMALLARYAMRNPTFRKLADAAYYYGDGFNMKNLNRLLGSYAGADGVKVGYTDIARKTIVASATRDGHRVYVSLMHSEDLVTDCEALFDWVWQTFTW